MAYNAGAAYTKCTLRDNTYAFLNLTAHTTETNGSSPVHSLPGPPSTAELSLHSAASSDVALPSNWEYSNRDHPPNLFGQNLLGYLLSQSPATITDSNEHQKLRTGRNYTGDVEEYVPSHPTPYGHAPSSVDMLTGFDVPLTESEFGLIRDTNLRNLYGHYLGGSNPWVWSSDVPDHRLHSLLRNPHIPPHQLTSHDDYLWSASGPNWRSTAISDTTSDSIRGIFDGSIMVPKSTLFDTPNGPSEATPDLRIQKQPIASLVAMKTAIFQIGDKEAQSSGLIQARRHGSATRSLGTVSNSSQRPTKALPYQRTLCKKDLRYTPEYLRIALSRLLKIVGKSLFVSRNILEPTIGSDLAKTILIEVCDRTGVWLGDKASEEESIYFLFIDRTSNLSLICGHDTRTSDRALGHIRSMLDHRPFPCLGKAHGCNSKKCSSSGDRPFRFFTEALRDDHIRRQGLKDECTTCGAMIRRGGMNRHVRLIHPEAASTPVLGEEGSSEEIS